MDNLKSWIEEYLSQNNCSLYELEWLTNQNPPLLRISIDKLDGVIDLDTCALCSDGISSLLDEKDWYGKEYMLEVCSPGAERELKTEQQMKNAIGSYVYVKFKNPKNGLDQVIGDLLEVNETEIVVSYKDKTRTKKAIIDKENIALIMTTVKI